MSLLKVNNRRTILAKSECKKDKNVVTIRSNQKSKQTVVEVVAAKPMDEDLQMPSELFSCEYIEEQNEVKEIPDQYYFESDHEAIRSNPDYLALMRSYALLQAKKIQAVKDVEDLLSARALALKDPRKFLVKFQDEFQKLPSAQRIPKVPNVDWNKYKIPSISHVVHKPETRYKGATKNKQSDKDAKEKVEGLLDCKVERNSKVCLCTFSLFK